MKKDYGQLNVAWSASLPPPQAAQNPLLNKWIVGAAVIYWSSSNELTCSAVGMKFHSNVGVEETWAWNTE
jgi:hypothetical protein